jgi:hypothetical protein
MSDDRPNSLYLPPRELWRHNPYEEDLIPTPLDSRGLVDHKELVKVVKSTVDPSYRWPSPINDKHHCQWPDANYPYLPESFVNPKEFRNLAINILIEPRIFHNWTHRITTPPPVPSKEVMQYRIDAQRVTISLYQTIRASKGIMRMNVLSDQELESRLIQHFDDFTTKLEVAKALPREFQLINLENYDPRDYTDMFKLGARLGELATVQTIVREVTRANAA